MPLVPVGKFEEVQVALFAGSKPDPSYEAMVVNHCCLREAHVAASKTFGTTAKPRSCRLAMCSALSKASGAKVVGLA
jgi:hypothetical protein